MSALIGLFKGNLCSLEWKQGIMVPAGAPEKLWQLAFLEAVITFLSNIFCMAYLNCKLLGLLFRPPLATVHQNNSSTWSCQYLYASNYLNG